ncbi:MAG: DUF4062 domain-containing protein [Lachnospiraceae bacterium]|nr:DUF4062 domain-containing protein [Lachnospiraceae bacterium]MBR1568505.1 DUF4062 domain-containing protein [Lachnospiraceae bacterium]
MKTVFVSSTFKDMQAERDVIRNEVLPYLNELGKEYGEGVSFCDLRWGVDTSSQSEEEANKTVLSVCLNEIDRARPYMIVLIGDRYGYMPGSAMIGHEVSRRKRFSLDDLEISVTQLEIEYGAFSGSKLNEHTFFYFRELEGAEIPGDYLAESEEYRRRLDQLKNRIRSIAGDHLYVYHAKWDGSKVTELSGLVNRIQKDLGDEFRKSWEDIASFGIAERTKKIQENYVIERLNFFSKDTFHPIVSPILDRSIAKDIIKDSSLTHDFSYMKLRNTIHPEGLSDIIAAARAHSEYDLKLAKTLARDTIIVHGSNYPVRIITGVTGSGKTMTLLHIARIMEKVGYKVIEVYCGITSLLSTSRGVLLYIIYHLEKLMEMDHKYLREEDLTADKLIRELDTDQALDYANMLAARFTEDKKYHKNYRILIAIDGIDRLQSGRERDSLQFIPEKLSDDLRVIMTADGRMDLPFIESVNELSDITEEEALDLIEGSLQSFGKQMAEEVRNVIISKEQAYIPLYLYMVISRLSIFGEEDFKKIREMGDGIENINHYLCSVVRDLPEDRYAMSYELMRASAEHINYTLFMKVAEYLAISRYGLRISDLEELAAMDRELVGHTFTRLQFAQFVNYMSELFMLRENGAYDYLHECTRDGIINEMGDRAFEINDAIITFLHTLPEEDEIRSRELMWHVLMTDRIPEIIRTIYDISTSGKELQDIVVSDIIDWLVNDQARSIREYLMLPEAQEETDAYLPTVLHFLCDRIVPQIGDKAKEEETTYILTHGMLAAAENCVKRRDNAGSREVLNHVRLAAGEFLLSLGERNRMKLCRNLLAKAHDGFDRLYDGAEDIRKDEYRRYRWKSLYLLYQLTFVCDDPQYIADRSRIMGDIKLEIRQMDPGREEDRMLMLQSRLMMGRDLYERHGKENLVEAKSLADNVYHELLTAEPKEIADSKGNMDSWIDHSTYNSFEADRLMIEACNLLGDILLENRDPGSVDLSLAFSRLAVAISAHRRDRDKSLKGLSLYREAYGKLAEKIYMSTRNGLGFGDYQKQEDADLSLGYVMRRAIELDEQFRTMRSKRIRCEAIHEKARIMTEMSTEKQNVQARAAVQHYEIELDLREELGDLYPYSERDYARCLYALGSARLEVNGCQFEEVYEPVKKAYDMAEELCAVDGSRDNLIFKADVEMKLAEILKDTTRPDNLRHAADYSEDAVKIYRQDNEMRQNVETSIRLAAALRSAGFVYELLGDKDSLRCAYDRIREAADIKEQLKRSGNAGKEIHELMGLEIVKKRIERRL